MELTSKSVPDREFTLKASVRGLELIIRGNLGKTGARDADRFTANLCIEVFGGEFSAMLVVAGKWRKCRASPSVEVKRIQNTIDTRLETTSRQCSDIPQEETLLLELEIKCDLF